MSRSILIFTIFTLITIIGWGAFSIFREISSSHVSKDVQQNLASIASSFDKDFLSQIYNRNK